MPCCPQPDGWVAQAQVWLGTLVEVALPAAESSDTCFAVAFAAIAHVHRVMSAHDASSDLARIAREAHRATVRVDAGTYAVLYLAQQLFRESGGTFDVAIAPLLARHGLLPPVAAGNAYDSGAPWGGMDALHLEPGLRVRTTAPVALDLGGIAKGYAVDRAVAALRTAGARAGLVNAGGDLRVFGPDAVPIHVRTGGPQGVTLPLVEIADGAVATSAYGGHRKRVDGRWATPLVDPRSSLPIMSTRTVSVVAATCMVADALTKVVALRGRAASAALRAYGASATVLSPATGRWRCMRLPAPAPAAPSRVPARRAALPA